MITKKTSSRVTLWRGHLSFTLLSSVRLIYWVEYRVKRISRWRNPKHGAAKYNVTERIRFIKIQVSSEKYGHAKS